MYLEQYPGNPSLRQRFLIHFQATLILAAGILLPLQTSAESSKSNIVNGEVTSERSLAEEFSRISGAGTVDEARESLTKVEQVLDQYIAITDPEDPVISKSTVEGARFFLEAEKVNEAALHADRAGLKNRVTLLETEVEKAEAALNKHLATNREDSIETSRLRNELNEKHRNFAAAKQNLEEIDGWIEISGGKMRLIERYLEFVESSVRAREQGERLVTIDDLREQLAQVQRQVQSRISEASRRYGDISGTDPVSEIKRYLVNLDIAEAKSDAHSLRVELATLQAEAVLEALPDIFSSETDVETLTQSLHLVNKAEREISDMILLSNEQEQLFRSTRELLESNDDIRKLLGKEYDARIATLDKQISRVSEETRDLDATLIALSDKQILLEETMQEAEVRDLTSRQSLIGLEMSESFLRQLPTAFRIASNKVLTEFNTRFRELGPRLGFEIGLPIILWGLALLMFGRFTGRKELAPELSFSAKSERIAAALFRRVRVTLFFAGAMVYAAWWFDFDLRPLQFLILVFSIVLGFQLTTGLSYWLFLSPLVEESHRQRSLHWWVYGISVLVAFFALFIGLGQIGYVERETLMLLDRMLMVLLLPVVYLMFRLRNLLISRIDDEMQTAFWVRLVKMASFLATSMVLVTAIVGLVGYVNLALFLAERMILIATLLVAWSMLRQLISDAVEALKQRVQKYSVKPKFWQQIVIDPLQMLLQLVLTLGAIYLLALIFGWDEPTSHVRQWMTYALFSFAESDISLLGILQSILYLFLAIFIGRWFRIASRDWFYRGIEDEALRNSLSIFTQYVVIVIGVFVGLTLLGINLTSLTVFAGALGVGIGFGLQAIANNFISGLILLAERPVRIADWVTIGSDEGKVSRIGSRSLTVTTWDNQDVIIPNADLISNAFTNWTLSDKLVRTVFLVGIRYQDDPHEAQRVIYEAVERQPEVSRRREPRILLTEFGSSSVNFRVEYYTNVVLHSRLEVKSKVMLAIWDALKKANIGIPFPQQDIYIKELPDSVGRPGESGILKPLPQEG